MFAKAFADWQEKVMNNSLNNEPFPVACVKAFGTGVIDGAVVGLAFVGLAALIAEALENE